MLLKTRIDIQKYLFLSILSTLVVLFFTDWEIVQVTTIIAVAIVTGLNHLMLVEAVCELLKTDNSTKKNNKKISLLLLGKTLILVAALLIGVHFIDRMIVLAIANYVMQITGLFFSLKKA